MNKAIKAGDKLQHQINKNIYLILSINKRKVDIEITAPNKTIIVKSNRTVFDITIESGVLIKL